MRTLTFSPTRLKSSFHKGHFFMSFDRECQETLYKRRRWRSCAHTKVLLSVCALSWGIMARTFRWDELLAEVAKRVPPQQFRAWLEPARFVEINGQHLVISVSTVFSRDWINDHHRDVFRAVLQELYGLHLSLKIEIDHNNETLENSDSSVLLTMPRPSAPHEAGPSTGNEGDQTPRPHQDEHWGDTEPNLFSFASSSSQENDASGNSDFENRAQKGSSLEASISLNNTDDGNDGFAPPPSISQEKLTAISVREMTAPITRTLGQPVDPKHTFETFVVGASNQFAHAAARAVAEQPATQYNPLFLYSDAGLGKTHLLHAIGNYVLRLNPKAKICFISAEKFVNDLIDSIHHGKMSQFRDRYRDSYDILLMDDIQFIAGKDRTQEEFFHTFNALHSSRRQIVVTSDKVPKDIPGLEDRIRTRFEWGLIADIQPPEIETRIAILRAKAEIDDVFLPNDVALFLASNIKSNIRELEGALIRLGAQASLTGSEISLDLAKQLLRNIIKEPTTTISADAITDAVARHFNVKVTDIKGRERSRRVALPRQIAMFLIRKYCDKSYPDIGIMLGGKDHSTVLHGVRAITSDIERDPDIRRHVEEIQNSL